MRPPSGNRRRMDSASIDLPQPDSPSRAKVSPRAMRSETPSTARTVPPPWSIQVRRSSTWSSAGPASSACSSAGASFAMPGLPAADLGSGMGYMGQVGIEHAKLDRQPHVEYRNLLVADRLQQRFGLFVRDREPDFHGKIARQFEEVVLVQHAMAAEAGDRPEGRTAVDPQLLRLLQQPLIGENAVQPPFFLHVELEVGPIHRCSPSLG